MTNYLEVKNLSKSFDSFQLHNISFTLPKGYIMGLIGPNGSGKTTTIKLILNMLKRNGGEIKIMGLDNIADEQKAKSELGVVFDTNYFSDDWQVTQVEKSISVFYPNWKSERFAEMLRKFHIAPTKKVKELSKGMQMKLMLACAFSYDAKLLILDEPTSGLDPVSRDELLQILSEYIEDGEHSVLFSTHITGDLERAADYITYISYGELFFSGSKDEFVDMFRIVKGGTEELSADLKEKAVGVRTFPTGFEALVKAEDTGAFSSLSIEPATIDEIVVFTSKKGAYLFLYVSHTILIPSNQKLQINYGGIIMANYTKTTIGKENRIELHEKLSLTGAEISLNELPAGANVPFVHSHKENEEIYGILSGNGKAIIDGEEISLSTGDWLKIAPAAKRQFFASDISGITYICIQVKENSLEHFTAEDAVIG